MNDPVINIPGKFKRPSFRSGFRLSGKDRQYSSHLFRDIPDRQNTIGIDALVKDKVMEDDSDHDGHIVCRRCGYLITRLSARMTVQMSHEHSFANPHGLVFRIGCFSTAEGCAYAGPFSNEFTWFKGYNWRIAVCGACLVHLGWLFVSAGGSSFNGLILDQLIINQLPR